MAVSVLAEHHRRALWRSQVFALQPLYVCCSRAPVGGGEKNAADKMIVLQNCEESDAGSSTQPCPSARFLAVFAVNTAVCAAPGAGSVPRPANAGRGLFH